MAVVSAPGFIVITTEGHTVGAYSTEIAAQNAAETAANPWAKAAVIPAEIFEEDS